MSFGIAFSGGGTRGAAHAGVLRALEEENMLPGSVSGTSAGSIAAGLYAIGMSSKEMEEIVMDLFKHESRIIDADYMGLLKAICQFFRHSPITFTGLIKGDKLENYLSHATRGKTYGTQTSEP
jgi:NTE family protein